MERWSIGAGKRIESADIDKFLTDLVEVFRKHGMSLGHEDSHGAFIVENFNQYDIDWLFDAHDGRLK